MSRALLDRARSLRAAGTERFLAVGWLIPAFFPLALIFGRGLLNSALLLYIAWALVAAPRLRQHGNTTFLVLLVALLASYLASIMAALDPVRTIKIWAMVVAYMSIAPITLAMLATHPDKLRELERALGIGALLALVVAYVDLVIVRLTTEHFIARLHVRAVDLPFCIPFLLAWLWQGWRGAARIAAIGLALGSLISFVVLSDERSPMMGALTACTVMGLLVLRLKSWQVLAAITVMVGLAFLINSDALLRGFSNGDELFMRLDSLSSMRLRLWAQTLANPPENALIGVGMGNAQYYLAVVHLGEITVRGLHNLWLDAWFETGALGLGMLIVMIVYVLARTARSWRLMNREQQASAGLFLTAALAVMMQSQFSITYSSREFGLYVFMCFAVLMHLVRQTSESERMSADTDGLALSDGNSPTRHRI